MPLPGPAQCIGQDDLSDSSTEDSFQQYKNSQRKINGPISVFKKPPARRNIFVRASRSVPRLRKSMHQCHLMHPRQKSLISSTPRNPSYKSSASQDSSLQLSPVKADANSMLAENFENIKQTQNIWNGLPKLSLGSNNDSGTVSDTTEKKPLIALQSEKPKPSLKKMHLMDRATQTTDSLNKGLPKLSIGNETQSSSKKSSTLRNSCRNEADDATIEESLEQFDADVAAHRPSIITISSASENISPVVSSNTIISDANLKTKNVALMQNNNLEISSSKEKRDVKNSSHLNVSHNTRSFRNNSMSKANNDQPAKEEKRMRTKNSSNHNRKQLQNVNSASENMSPVVSSNNFQEQPEPDCQNSYRKDNNNASFKEEKASNSAAAANKSTSRQMNTKNKETPTNTSKITRTKRQTVNSNCNYSELDNSPEVVKKSRRRKTVSKSSKGKSRSSRNSTDRKEDKRTRNSKSVSTAVSRKYKAFTSQVMNSQHDLCNRVSGFVQIEHNHQTTEGARKSARVRRAPSRYNNYIVSAPGPKTRSTRSTRQSAAQQPRSNPETTAADNENVFKKPLVRSSAKRRGRPPNNNTSAVRKKPKSTNLEKTVIEVPSQIETSVPKAVKESSKKSVTFNEAETSTKPLAKTLFPPHNKTEYSRRLYVFDDDVQHDEEKEPRNRQNEELDQKTLYTIINNDVVGIEWTSSMPSQTSKSSQDVTVTYFFKNLKIQQGTVSNGLIRFGPGQHMIQVTRKHWLMYKVEQGEATINIQLQKGNFGVGCSFHIPLGSTYSITNLSEVEPLVLFFTKASAS